MTYFTHHWITSRIIRIVDATNTALYLFLGDERAMLVDTGAGIGSLRAYVDGLTKLPYDVLLTHGHVDHAGGAGEFADKTIYLHPGDRPLMKRNTTLSDRKDFAWDSVKLEVTYDDLVPQFDEEKTTPLTHGDRFDLGNLTLEVIHVPGHTRGMCMVLAEEERTILFGDGCGVNVMIVNDDATSVEEYCEALHSLLPYEDRYDHIIRNHGTCVSPKELLRNVIEVCDSIVAGTDDHEPFPPQLLPTIKEPLFYARKVDDHLRRLDGVEGNLVYAERKIHRAQ